MQNNAGKSWHEQMDVPMIFQPNTLKDRWYVLDVSKNILAHLDGLRKYAETHIENKYNKKAYLSVMDRCISACRAAAYSPTQMLWSLDSVKSSLTENSEATRDIFSRKYWFSSIVEYEEKAMDECVDLVRSIYQKYLVHD